MSIQASIDIGGTFTDLVVVDGNGGMATFKAQTTPSNYIEGVMETLKKAGENLNLSVEELMAECSSSAGGTLVHGSTISTNAIIENKIAKTGLLVTRGFRDILLLREGGRPDAYDFTIPYPEPYTPRYLTLPVTERVNAEGGVEVELDEESVRKAIKQLKKWDVEAIAVSLLWSISNPSHELRVGEIIEEVWPEIPYVLGHQVNPCIREYRRTSSAAIDASLKPIMNKYIDAFQERLNEAGYTGNMLMLTSSGGVVSVDELRKKPILSIDSGPALAPAAGLWYAQSELGKNNIITCDMGGTSFDVAAITEGRIPVSREASIGAHKLGITKVDCKTLGAGGGSIAWVDPGGLLHVGPQSAGSIPGPACYGRGGHRPTVTDANIVLGYLDPGYFLGGEIKLDPKLPQKSIMEEVGRPLGLDLEEAAYSIWSTVNVNMTTAIKEITIQRGIDPSEYSLVAGGGASGLHIVSIAGELGVKEILIPKTAGTISAVGGVFADLVAEYSASAFADSRQFDFAGVNKMLASLEEQSEAFLDRAGIEKEKRQIEFYVEARYGYQVYELSVPLRGSRIGNDEVLSQLIEDFHDTHEKFYAVRDPGQYLECIYWRAKATGERSKPELKGTDSRAENPQPSVHGKRKAYIAERGGMAEIPVYRGERLSAGNRIDGLAIIEEPTMTILMLPEWSATVTELGSYLLERI